MPAGPELTTRLKILLLTLDPPLDPSRVATGNQVRTQGIAEALVAAGHEVLQAVPTRESERPDADEAGFHAYRTREELDALVREQGVEAILAGYWALLAHVGQDGPPVILDFIAPRLLEQLYQAPGEVAEHAAELIGLLPRADHFLVGNQRQADLLLGLLLQAGFDCREQVPVSVVPICARARHDGAGESEAAGSRPPRLVSAGVRWPWRQAEDWQAELRAAEADGEAVLVELSGDYPGTAPGGGDGGLLPYAGMQAALQACDIGLELGDRNPEREFSHSFRALEYLECGLPIMINPWIPLAASVREYQAGWVVESPSQLREVLAEIRRDPGLLAARRQGARRLVSEQLNYGRSCQPLLQYLDNPIRPKRFGAAPDPEASAGEAPGLRDFVESPAPRPSTFKVLLGAMFKILFCPKRPDATPDVLMVSRSDLFPTDHGAAVKIIRTAEALSRQGRDVWLATDDRREYYQFRNGERSTHRYPWYMRLTSLPRSVAFARLILKGFPVNNGFLYLPVTDGSFVRRAVWLASRKPVGAYLAEFPAYVRPLRFARSLFGGKLLLVQHNVEYERIRHQVADLSERNFHALKSTELAMCQLADQVVTVSDNDRRQLIRDGINPDKLHTIPHGVDLHAFRDTPVSDLYARFDLPAGEPVLAYHGTYSYPPNLEAMQVMAEEILPRLAQRGYAVTVLAVGSHRPDFPLHEKIRFVGSVDQLAEVLPAADMAVVPLQDGGGTRMKILDYFAARVPVISTAKGIEGIPVENGREAIIVDEFEPMVDAIIQLLEQPETAAGLVDNATRFVESLGWDAIARRYLPLMK